MNNEEFNNSKSYNKSGTNTQELEIRPESYNTNKTLNNKFKEPFNNVNPRNSNSHTSQGYNNNDSNNKNSNIKAQSNKVENLGIVDSIKRPNSSENKQNNDNDNITDDLPKSKAELRRYYSDKNKKVEKAKTLKYLARGQISIKYKVFLITLWIIFLASFIVGFITHFDLKLPVTASGIIWSFSFIVLVIAIVYSVIFYKISKSNLPEEKYRLLQNFPL